MRSNAGKSGPPLWMCNFTNELAEVTPVPVADIESTPVIDAAAGVIYVVARWIFSRRPTMKLSTSGIPTSALRGRC
jgi:hypothetical protein